MIELIEAILLTVIHPIFAFYVLVYVKATNVDNTVRGLAPVQISAIGSGAFFRSL